MEKFVVLYNQPHSKRLAVFQVHARNILRALYKETKLGEDVFPYVADGVQVAVEGFLSEIWAVSCLHYRKIEPKC